MDVSGTAASSAAVRSALANGLWPRLICLLAAVFLHTSIQDANAAAVLEIKFIQAYFNLPVGEFAVRTLQVGLSLQPSNCSNHTIPPEEFNGKALTFYKRRGRYGVSKQLAQAPFIALPIGSSTTSQSIPNPIRMEVPDTMCLPVLQAKLTSSLSTDHASDPKTRNTLIFRLNLSTLHSPAATSSNGTEVCARYDHKESKYIGDCLTLQFAIRNGTVKSDCPCQPLAVTAPTQSAQGSGDSPLTSSPLAESTTTTPSSTANKPTSSSTTNTPTSSSTTNIPTLSGPANKPTLSRTVNTTGEPTLSSTVIEPTSPSTTIGLSSSENTAKPTTFSAAIEPTAEPNAGGNGTLSSRDIAILAAVAFGITLCVTLLLFVCIRNREHVQPIYDRITWPKFRKSRNTSHMNLDPRRPATPHRLNSTISIDRYYPPPGLPPRPQFGLAEPGLIQQESTDTTDTFVESIQDTTPVEGCRTIAFPDGHRQIEATLSVDVGTSCGGDGEPPDTVHMYVTVL